MDATANYEVHFIGGCKDGVVSVRHVCGRHVANDHQHLGARGHIYEFISEVLQPSGIWIHTYADYLLACDDVDNFVKVMYIGDETYMHGHTRGKPCTCFMLGLE